MFLVWLLLSIVFDMVGIVVLEMFLAITHALDEDRTAKGLAALWLALIGLIVGVVTVVMAPERLLARGPFPGVSLLAIPTILGASMTVWGQFRGHRGKNVSHLGTWYGGAALGLGLAAGRLLALRFAAELRVG